MANKTFFIANQHSFATSKCFFGTDSISSGSEEDTLLCDILCSVTRNRCFVTKTPCSVGKALLSGTEKLSPLFVEVQQVEDGSVFLDGRFRSGVRSLLPVGYKVQFRQKPARFFIVALTVAALHRPPLQFFGSLVGFPVSLRSDL